MKKLHTTLANGFLISFIRDYHSNGQSLYYVPNNDILISKIRIDNPIMDIYGRPFISWSGSSSTPQIFVGRLSYKDFCDKVKIKNGHLYTGYFYDNSEGILREVPNFSVLPPLAEM